MGCAAGCGHITLLEEGGALLAGRQLDSFDGEQHGQSCGVHEDCIDVHIEVQVED